MYKAVGRLRRWQAHWPMPNVSLKVFCSVSESVPVFTFTKVLNSYKLVHCFESSEAGRKGVSCAEETTSSCTENCVTAYSVLAVIDGLIDKRKQTSTLVCCIFGE